MFNSCTLVGNLTKDPDLRYTGTGKAVANVTVAVNSRKKTADPLFMDCTAWEGLAETIAQNLKKGSKVLVNGSLATQKWEDKEGGKHSRTVLELRDCEFLTPKSNGTGAGTAPEPDGQDVPF